MALSARLCGRGLLTANGLRSISINQCRRIAIIPQPATPPPLETHDGKNTRLNRPLSPHLTIYKFQLTAMLSITHRFTGMALSSYVAAMGVTSLVAKKPIIEVIQTLQTINPNILALGKLILIFPFTYHFCNGIRHLVWDGGKALTIKGVYTTGYVMLSAATLSAILFLLL